VLFGALQRGGRAVADAENGEVVVKTVQ
jgi:hypothetical protein